jgi:mannose-6-phosphate isomerase-like protein (cupin superfamily)
MTASSSTDRIHDPVHRVAFTFEPEGDDLWVSAWLEPGGHLPEHLHPSLVEHWETLEGVARVKLDGTWRDLRPQDGPVAVTPGVRHELRNTSGETAALRCRVSPAGGLQDFLTEAAQAARDGLYDARNLPTSLRGAGWIARFALRFEHETVMCSPPPAVQRVLLPLVARLAGGSVGGRA